MSQADFRKSESGMIRSKGHCNTMGTASTMAIMAEALGPRSRVAGTPAPDSRLLEHAHAAGRLAVEMVQAERRLSDVVTLASFHNAIVALAATGGSTNAVVHLLAIAGRLGIELRLEDFDRIGSRGAVAGERATRRHVPDGRHVQGRWASRCPPGGEGPARPDRGDRHRPAADGLPRGRPDLGRGRHPPPERPADGQRRHRRAPGTLAPNGAVIKPAAASKDCCTGRAVVFDSIEDFIARIDDPDLDIDETCVMVLRGCGPKGYPGMPEAANTPLPAKLLAAGVRDMIRSVTAG